MSLVPAFDIGIWNAWIFMIWLIIQNLAITLISKEAYQRAGNPPDMKISRTYKILSLISTPFWLLSTIYSIFLPIMLGTVWFTLGLIIFLFGLFMSLTSTINFVTTPMNVPVTKGIYRYSRHPMYVSLVLLYLSVGIASASWIFILMAIIWSILLSISIMDEERYCLEKYGSIYRKYLERTPRWLGLPKQSNHLKKGGI